MINKLHNAYYFIRFYMHFRQQIHLGVLRDLEIRELRKAENVYILQQQRELAKELDRERTIKELN